MVKKAGTCLFVSLAPGDALRAAKRIFERNTMVTCAVLGWQLEYLDEQLCTDPYDECEVINVVVNYARKNQVSGIVTFDERAVAVTAALQAALGLPGNHRDAAYASRNKFVMRSRFFEAGLATPDFALVRALEDARILANSRISFPLVLKPLFGMASEGVLRINDHDELQERFEIVRGVADTHRRFNPNDQFHDFLLMESYLDGPEVAVDGFLADGEFCAAGIFDKPDPLDGPTFAESIYVSPSILSEEVADQVIGEVARGAGALGLKLGPIHAELRLTRQGPVLLEIGARAIGGVCGRAHSYRLGLDYQELAIRSSQGERLYLPTGPSVPSGVMMINPPQNGRLEAVDGLEDARRIDGVCDALITSKPGDILVGLPEKGCYLGFIFAIGSSRAEVISRLRQSYGRLRFTIAPL